MYLQLQLRPHQEQIFAMSRLEVNRHYGEEQQDWNGDFQQG